MSVSQSVSLGHLQSCQSVRQPRPVPIAAVCALACPHPYASSSPRRVPAPAGLPPVAEAVVGRLADLDVDLAARTAGQRVVEAHRHPAVHVTDVEALEAQVERRVALPSAVKTHRSGGGRHVFTAGEISSDLTRGM